MDSSSNQAPLTVAVVIPCYRVGKHILDLLENIGDEVSRIYVVDDCCPEKSGALVREQSRDDRVTVLENAENAGVGGATIAGISEALEDNVDIVVKLDGDGQYDPALIPALILPIVNGSADATKGNRFYNLENLSAMPRLRKLGNAALSFITKLVSGYWNVMDPTNGFLAIHASVLKQLPLDKLDQRYYFESDLLFRLSISRAVVQDIPLAAFYADETSSLSIRNTLLSFPVKHLNRLSLRLFYSYFLRDFNMGSLALILGVPLTISGFIYGAARWADSIGSGEPATAGMVMISAIQLVVGIQLLLSFINYDINNTPTTPVHKLLYAQR